MYGLVEYMKWKSEETLAAYQHYFDEQRDADTHNAFHQRMHGEIQQYLEERKQGCRKIPTLRKCVTQETEASPQEVIRIPDEPDLAFLYSLSGECNMAWKKKDEQPITWEGIVNLTL